MPVHAKRVYEKPAAGDGYRVLVDRVWPRGLTKAEVDMDEWLKDVAPSSALRKWFGHVPARFDEFRTRYHEELKGTEALAHLRKIVADHADVTLLYSARDEQHNQAIVLRDLVSRSSP